MTGVIDYVPRLLHDDRYWPRLWPGPPPWEILALFVPNAVFGRILHFYLTT
jgi:hypothetical protein